MNTGLSTRVIVLGASRYKFPNPDTGEVIEGSKVHYVEQNFTPEADSLGAIPQTANLDYEFINELRSIPGVYDAEFSISLRRKTPTIKVTGFKHVGAFSLADQPQKQPEPVAK
ncbi:hypothetical protein ACFSR7_36115 [Cohnella sp. GCM10020058]|uniref:hypothetical protein n=1 Tax=Cohnella sp. GCM10020058 TaxID=3317330 RepID=UPI003636BE6C